MNIYIYISLYNHIAPKKDVNEYIYLSKNLFYSIKFISFQTILCICIHVFCFPAILDHGEQ